MPTDSPAPESPTPPTNEPFRPTRITADDFNADEPVPAGDIVQPPAPAPVPEPGDDTPSPTPTPEATPAPFDPASLFGDPEPPAPEAAPVPDEVDPPGYQEAPGDNLVAHLRNQIKEGKREAEQKAQEIRDREEQVKKENETLRRELALANPLLDEHVTEANENLSSEVQRIAKTMSDPRAARAFLETAKDIADEYQKLGDFYSEGYDERFNKFREGLQQNFGQSAEAILREMPRVDELRGKMEAAVQNANVTSVDTHRQRALNAHTETAKVFRSAATETLSYNEELAKIDPYSAQNVIAKMIEGVPAFGESHSNLLSTLETALIPPKPILPEDAPSLSADERNMREQERMATFQQNSQEVQKLIPLAFHTLQAVPMLAKALADARASLKAYTADQPPAPNTSSAPPTSPELAPGPNDQTYRPISKSELIDS